MAILRDAVLRTAPQDEAHGFEFHPISACSDSCDARCGGGRKRPMLKVFCARSMHVAVRTLADAFTAETGEVADIVFEPMGALQARLAAGETADVLILASPAIEALAKSGALVA